MNTPYQYTGQKWEEDDALEVYYYQARWYDPALRRFLQPDTIVPEPGNPQTLNRYAYGLNNPVRYNDPTGHDAGINPVLYPQANPNSFRYPVDPLSQRQKDIARDVAGWFAIPYELVAATLAVEIVDDTTLRDPVLDLFGQRVPLALHYAPADPRLKLMADLWLAGYEHYFGLLGARGPGNGIANIHIATAKEVEAYFAEHYPDAGLLPSPPDHFARADILLDDFFNICYAAAVLRRNADYRTGARTEHLKDLTILDMQMIYGRFRCECWRSWPDYQTAIDVPPDSRGQLMPPYLLLYAQD